MSHLKPCSTIPQDIWFEILKELPVKALGKCRCVCKSWRSLVVSPSFMAAHLKHYTRNEANSVILYKQMSTSLVTDEYVMFRDIVQLKLGNRLHTSVCPLALQRYCGWPCSFFNGSVNGLLCVSDFNIGTLEGHIMLWNPVIQKSIKLPNSTCTKEDFVVGFGCDYQRNDHRVVKISDGPLVEVYSVQGRAWKTISAKYLVDNSINRPNMVFTHCFYNGVIHWIIHSRDPKIYSCLDGYLLLFDVAKEEFSRMEIPLEPTEYKKRYSGMFVYKDMLSLSHCEYTSWQKTVSPRCQIWVKRDYNVESSWCKILCVQLVPGFYHEGPVQYLGEDEDLIGFASYASEELVCYDPKSHEITELSLPASQSTKFSTYSESLVLLDHKTDDPTA